MEEQKNIEILFPLTGKRTTISELIDLGFRDNTIIKSDTRLDNLSLGKITYHNSTYYEGVTLKIISNDFVEVITNSYNESEAKTLNEIRDKVLNLESLKNQITTYRYEFKDNEVANELEKKIEPLEAEITALRLQLKFNKFD